MTFLLENIFLILRVDGIYVILSSGLKVWLLLPLSKILSAFFTRSLGMGLASSNDDLIFKTDFSYFLFPLTEEGGYFRFGVLANHLAFIFFLPPSGDSLGLLYVPVPHSLPIRSQSTNISWFPFWPGFVTSG